jgi:hypothetical protein
LSPPELGGFLQVLEREFRHRFARHSCSRVIPRLLCLIDVAAKKDVSRLLVKLPQVLHIEFDTRIKRYVSKNSSSPHEDGRHAHQAAAIAKQTSSKGLVCVPPVQIHDILGYWPRQPTFEDVDHLRALQTLILPSFSAVLAPEDLNQFENGFFLREALFCPSFCGHEPS